MGYGRRWKPSKTAAREFAKEMEEIREFCDKNDIGYSKSMDSYYFTINEREYRVSNHSVEASNRGAYDDFGNQLREKYHEGGRKENVTYIHASKTRIREIYNDLIQGHELDGRGNRVY